MNLFDTRDRRPVHLMGIAGAGMSGLAELLVRRGVVVTGCDAAADGADDLRRAGIAVVAGHDPSHVEGARALVVTSAVPQDHPELARARALGLAVVRRAEALGAAVNATTLVAVAGTHGKTTTTAMTTEALAAAGRNPTGLAGGRVATWRGNLRPGGTDLSVVEADEYDRSFHALVPTVAVVTNVEADHLDVYRDLADIRGAFEQFVAPARTVVLCADDPGASALTVSSGAEVIRYGLTSNDARLVGDELMVVDGLLRFVVRYDGEELGALTLRVPGMHNVRNALAAVGAGLALGATLDAMRPGLEGFEGVERRFQRLGTVRGIDVVDDYAHHPTEIVATLDAARSAFAGRRIIAAFQPHLFSRTRDFAPAFAAALIRADQVFLTEIYPARERPIPGVTSELIANALAAAGRPVAWRGERAELAAALADAVREGDVVITLGAGDITRAGPELLQRLVAVA
ncbi:MAG TPA: UDP-N-acetylmuramate--L-alanine ligase [Gemmatimonadaceae bacterium]